MGVQEGTFLALKVGAAEYGISILRVSEIVNRVTLVGLPQARAGVRGMMPWRGKVIPVVDLGEKMGYPQGDERSGRRIVVVEYSTRAMPRCCDVLQCGRSGCPAYGADDRHCWAVPGTHCRGEIQGTYQQKIDACRACPYYQAVHGEGHVRQAGLLVEGVTAIRTVDLGAVEPTENVEAIGRTPLVTGLVRHDEHFMLLLSVEQVLGAA